MKRLLKFKLIFPIIFLTFFSTIGMAVYGGPTNPCDDPLDLQAYCLCLEQQGQGGTEEWNSLGCPIDSYVYILLAAGVGLGIKRVRDNKKEEVKA